MALKKSSVCFTGHRLLSSKAIEMLGNSLPDILEGLYQKGYRRFITGGAIGFDTLAAEYVLRMQLSHLDVKLIMAVPCSDQTRRWSQQDITTYNQIKYAADECRVLAQNYFDGCMLMRDRYMVDHSSACICYMNENRGGTYYTFRYAYRKHSDIINLAMPDARWISLEAEDPVSADSVTENNAAESYEEQ